ncbi:MAG: ABC transporter substrate-binding protein [Acidobacteriota bacterium]
MNCDPLKGQRKGCTSGYPSLQRLLVLLLLATAACTGGDSASTTSNEDEDTLEGASLLSMAYAKTFQVFERDGYRVVDLSAPLVSWGGSAQGAAHSARVVLVPKAMEAPPLTGDLEDAVVVRTPVARIATNDAALEAIAAALGITDRLVAVGGVTSYNDDVRARARAGELAQIRYGWSSPPNIGPLLDSEPDVFLMALGDLGHAEHYERIRDLGVPVVPVFLDGELSYMGPVDYVRLVGMMSDREAEAGAFVSMVAENVRNLKALTEGRPPKTVLSAWYDGSGRWMATVRNAENALLQDAGGVNPLAQSDDVRLDGFVKIGTEVLLESSRDADCWIIRDTHSVAFDDVTILENFKSWREGCLFAADGMVKPEANAFDLYETGSIRPDLILGDMVRMLHPEVRDEPFLYYRPDTEMVRP